MVAGLLCCCPMLVHEEHLRKNGKWSKDKEPNDSVTKKDVSFASHFSHGDPSRAIYSHSEHISRVAWKYGISTLFFSPSRSDLVVQRSRFFRNPHREIHNLGMVSGLVLSRIQQTNWIFILLSWKTEKNEIQNCVRNISLILCRKILNILKGCHRLYFWYEMISRIVNEF